MLHSFKSENKDIHTCRMENNTMRRGIRQGEKTG